MIYIVQSELSVDEILVALPAGTLVMPTSYKTVDDYIDDVKYAEKED